MQESIVLSFDAKRVEQWGQRVEPVPGALIIRWGLQWSEPVEPRVPYDEAGVYLGAGLVLVARRGA